MEETTSFGSSLECYSACYANPSCDLARYDKVKKTCRVGKANKNMSVSSGGIPTYVTSQDLQTGLLGVKGHTHKPKQTNRKKSNYNITKKNITLSIEMFKQNCFVFDKNFIK